MFAWSDAGGPVPAEKHFAAIALAARGCRPFDPGIEVFKPVEDEIPSVSLAALAKRLEAARTSGTLIAALHLLCHGGEGAGEPDPLALLVRKLRGVRGETAGSEPATAESVLGEAARLREAHPGRQLLLVVDQFEEVFTALADEARQALGQTLWKLAGTEVLGIVVVATLRVDFFGRARELRLDPSTGLDKIVYADRSREFVQPLEGAILDPLGL